MAKSKTVSFDDALPVCGKMNFASTEAYNLLQTSIRYSFAGDEGCKVVGVTSSVRNEGKSTIAVNLAYSLAADKQKVLLLEGDMRLPSLSKKISIETTPGLSDYLTGKLKGSEGVQYPEIAPGMAVIPAGVAPPNPFRLLGSDSMRDFLEEQKKVFDYIIVDLPPVSIVSDPLAIAKFLDGFIVVVRDEYTTRQSVQDVVKKLQIVGANILGFVINGDASGGGHYGRYGRYGKYGRYDKYGKYGKYAEYYSEKDYEKSYESASKAAAKDSNETASDDNADAKAEKKKKHGKGSKDK